MKSPANYYIEVWAIVIDGGMLPPIDDDAARCFMAFPTEEDAEACLKSRVANGYIQSGHVQRVA